MATKEPKTLKSKLSKSKPTKTVYKSTPKGKAAENQKSKTAQGRTPKKPKAVKLPKRNSKGQIVAGVAQETNVNGTAGAPTKYEARFCDEIIGFFSGEKYQEVVAEKEVRETKQGRTEKTKFKYIANDLPHLEAFARSVGVKYQTLYNWAHDKNDDGSYKNPEFFDAYNIAKQLQKEWLIENGLKGHYPPASFIFVAKNITDMKDTKDVKVTNPGEVEGDVSDAELEEAIFE